MRLALVVLVLSLATGCGSAGQDAAKVGAEKGSAAAVELLNVSYDPTRELWKDLNGQFASEYSKSGGAVTIKQSHGGSGTQARAVIDGLEADVVTLAMWTDTDAVRKAGLIQDGWEKRLPENSLPYYSTIVFVVRKGNPKGVKDWGDLLKPDVQVITPNPKTSGNGKLSLLSAYGYVKQQGKSEEEAIAFLKKLYDPAKIPVLDSGARGSTTTFAQKNVGDVHLTWENEAHLEIKESGGELELVYPSTSIKAEPYVAVVDGNVDRRKTRAAAEAYLKHLYTPEAQETIAKHFYRPSSKEVLAKHSKDLPEIKLFTIGEIAGNWTDAQAKFFAEGAIFDQIYTKK